MIAQLLVLAVFPALLAAAAGWDLVSYTIPNLIPIALVVTFAAYALAMHMALPVLGLHLAVGAGGLAVGFGLFAFGIIGGGDAKLFAAVALMFGYDDMLGYTVFALLLGGGLTLLILVLRQVPLPEVLAREDWIARLHAPDSGVPYGVALAAGAYLLLPYSVIFHAVAAG